MYPKYHTMCTMLVFYSFTPNGYFSLCSLNFREVNINSYPASTIVVIIRSNVTYRNSLYQRYPAANCNAYIGSHIDWEWRNVSMHFSMLFIVKTRVKVISGPVITAMTQRTWRIVNIAQLSWLRLCQVWETGVNRQELWLKNILWSWITCHQLLKPTVEGAVITELFC